MESERELRNRLDLIYRGRIVCFGISDAGEQKLIEDFLLHVHREDMPYAVEYEWDYVRGFTNLGRGDLVMADRPIRYGEDHEPALVSIIEAKYFVERSGATARTRNKNGRNKAREQVFRSVQAWQERHPEDTVYGYTLFNGLAAAWNEPFERVLIDDDEETVTSQFYLYEIIRGEKILATKQKKVDSEADRRGERLSELFASLFQLRKSVVIAN